MRYLYQITQQLYWKDISVTKKIINLLGKNERISEINFLKKISKVVRSADQLFDAIKDIDKSGDLRIQKEKLNEIRNFDDDFDSFDSILDAIDNLQDVKSYDSLYKSVYFNLISKLRMFKNVIKNLLAIILTLIR